MSMSQWRLLRHISTLSDFGREVFNLTESLALSRAARTQYVENCIELVMRKNYRFKCFSSHSPER